MNRRSLLAGVGTTGLIGVAGCLGVFDDVTSFEATAAEVSQSALDETGYQSTGVEEIEIEEEFEAAGQSESVVVINYLSEYTKTLDLGPLGEHEMATFAVFATPKVEILGQTFNPVEEMSTEELIDLIADNYDDLGEIEHEEDGSATVLDQTVTESQFTSQASVDGQPVDLALHVTEAAERGDDLVVAIGAYPQLLESQEQSNVYQLMESITSLDEAVEDGEADDSETADSDGNDANGDTNDSDDANGESDELLATTR